MSVSLPRNTQRLAILGKTGEGKTVAAVWHLSNFDFDKMPWVIFDFKNDSLIGKIGATPWRMQDGVPKKPGLYVVRPLPNQSTDVEKFLWEIWANEYTGVYIDEGYMIDSKSEAFPALLTQGRSKRIPMIVLSQRPKWISRFVFSEADYFQVFWLNDTDDRKRVQQFFPHSTDINKRLPRYHSFYYDVAADEVATFRPVPREEEIISIFRAKLTKRIRLL